MKGIRRSIGHPPISIEQRLEALQPIAKCRDVLESFSLVRAVRALHRHQVLAGVAVVVRLDFECLVCAFKEPNHERVIGNLTLKGYSASRSINWIASDSD